LGAGAEAAQLKAATQELKTRLHEEVRRPTTLSPAAIGNLELAIRNARRPLWRIDAALARGDRERMASCEVVLGMLELAQVGRAATLAEVRATEYLGPGFGAPLLLQESLDRLEELFALHGQEPDAVAELLAASLRWNRQVKRGDASRVEQLGLALRHLATAAPLRRFLDGQVLMTLGRVAEGRAAGGEALRGLLAAAAASSPATEPAELPLLATLAELRFQQNTEVSHEQEHAAEVRAVAALGGDGAAGASPARQRLFALAALHEANAALLTHPRTGTTAVLAEPLRRRLERVVAAATDENHVRKAQRLLRGELAYDAE
jgi:hypothetical protein